jgi:hypothetical protein
MLQNAWHLAGSCIQENKNSGSIKGEKFFNISVIISLQEWFCWTESITKLDEKTHRYIDG